MRMLRNAGPLLAGLVIGCGADLTLPDSAIVTCTAKGECPRGYSCDLELQRCVAGTSERPAAPTLALQDPRPASGTRYVDAVLISFHVDDRNIPVGDYVVVSFEYGVGSSPSEWFAATPSDGAFPTVMERQFSGVFRWDAKADAEAGKGLALHANGYVALTPEVVVRAVATDSGDIKSNVVSTQVFALGNTPPSVEMQAFQADVYAGLIPIGLVLTDASADALNLEVEFRTAQDGTWRRADIEEALITRAPSSAAGSSYLLAWRSATAPHANASTPQGVGGTWQDDIELRARALDTPDGVTSFYGPWSSVRVLPSVRNQTPPQILELGSLRAPGSDGTAPFGISYVLADEQSDPADVRVDISFDNGVSWEPVPEFPVPASEGFFDLATRPLKADGSGGVRHVLMLDPAWLTERSKLARLRLTATDGFPPEAPAQTSAEMNLGQLGAALSLPAASTLIDTYCFDVVVGDFLGDGHLDFAVARSNGTAFFQGKGDGTFLAPITRSGSDFPSALVAGDFNGDGRPDVARVMSSNDTVLVYFSQAGGTISTGTSFALGATPEYAIATDVNDDGALDLVTSNRTDNSLSILRGDGVGGFSAAHIVSGLSSPRGLVAADYNSDGAVDLATTDGDDLVVLLNDGAGGFDQELLVTTDRTQPITLVADDFNGDGLPDLLATFYDDSEAVLFVNEGDALVAMTSVAVTPFPGGYPTTGASVDLNGDGRPEAILLTGGRVNIHLGGELAGLSLGPLAFETVDGAAGIAAGDFNEDGAPDLVVVGLGVDDEKISIHTSSHVGGFGGGGFVQRTHTPAGTAPRRHVIADLDADGVSDVVVVSESTNTALLLYGQHTSGVPWGVLLPTGSISLAGTAYDVAAAHLDHDDWIDLAIIVRDAVNSYLVPYFGVDGYRFEPGSAIVIAGLPVEVATDDFNNDGVADIVTVNRTGSSATVLLGQLSAGVWSATATHYAMGTSPRGLQLGDFNNDGATDFIAAVTGSIVVRRNNGLGDFSTAKSTAVAANFYNLVVGDLNADGTDDFAGIGLAAPMVGVNNGDETFAVSAAYALCGGGSSVIATADFTGDGALDIISGAATSCFLRNGTTGKVANAVFTAATDAGGTRGAQAGAADLNGDGLQDVLYVVDSEHRVDVRFGRDEQSYQRALTLEQMLPRGELVTLSTRFLPQQSPKVHFSSAVVVDRRVRMQGLTLLATGTAHRQKLLTLTPTLRVLGDQKLQRVPADEVTLGASAGDRLRVVSRLGAPRAEDAQARVGLDLNATPERGVVVTLPVYPARSALDLSQPDRVRLIAGVSRYRSAAEFADDPHAAHADAWRYLPRAQKADGSYRDVLIEDLEWVEIPRAPQDDLAQGEGARFAVDEAGFIFVLTDKTGLFQAFYDTTP